MWWGSSINALLFVAHCWPLCSSDTRWESITKVTRGHLQKSAPIFYLAGKQHFLINFLNEQTGHSPRLGLHLFQLH